MASKTITVSTDIFSIWFSTLSSFTARFGTGTAFRAERLEAEYECIHTTGVGMALFTHPVAGACAAMSSAVPSSREGELSVAKLTILLPQLLANVLQHRDAAHGRSSQLHVCCRKCEISPHHAECGLWTFGRPFKARHAHVAAGRGSWRVCGDHMPAVACVRDHRWVGLSR